MAQVKSFLVDTSPTKEVVVSSLTRDASVEACVFDLIDNAIDAARNTTFDIARADAEHILLDDYTGYTVSLVLSGEKLKIVDNCGGIPVARLEESVLRFGQPSTQHMGIGVFGVGLNRALFKLGKTSTLETDTGIQRSKVVLDTEKYLDMPDDWSLQANQLPTSGRVGTSIEILGLPSDISQNFGDPDWVLTLRAEVGSRYARFIDKGLSIEVNEIAAVSRSVPYREGGPFDGEYKMYKAPNGVSVHIRYGEHRDHRFKKETGEYSLERNKAISSEYGWTIYCNDRAILICDTDWKTGWDNFHTEYNGFVGTVSFIGADPGTLPWNTTKTDVDLNNETYQTALADMRKFNKKWREFADKRKRSPAEILPPILAPKDKPKDSLPKPPRPNPTPPPSPRKPDHNEIYEILPSDIQEVLCQDKHLALIHEGRDLSLWNFPYAGMALMRMLFEVSAREFARRNGMADELNAFCVTYREGKLGRKLKAPEVRDLTPKFDECLAFMETRPDMWGIKAGAMRTSVTKMKGHQKVMNGAVHHTWQTINRSEAFRIRDDMIPILRHLIET